MRVSCFIKKADILLAAGLLALGAALSLPIFLRNGSGDTVTIQQNGVLLYEGSLHTDTIVEAGGVFHNTIEISGGAVRFAASDCPGQDCVRLGPASAGALACAPNGVIISIGSGSRGEVDSIAS